MIRENNQKAGKTWIWTYDDAGNILTKKEYAYTTGTLGSVVDTITYTYGNANWGDLLTKYDGVTISYDSIGNPLSDGTWTYTWQQGRNLATMSNGSTTWTYTYDANGMRTKRTTGSTTYTYTYNGSQLTHMTYGSTALHFYYDASGSPLSVTYGGATYYYVLNLQGDVVAILNSSGVQVVGYTYDAWGRPLSTTGSMSSTLGLYNPLRYRGYVYDRETGLYYLQSRYYNPTWGRFISADSQMSTGDFSGLNLFAYCGNNPVNRVDPAGEAWWHWAVAAGIVVAAAAAVVITAGGAAAALSAVALVANGVAVSSTATTVAAGVFIGSASALAISAYGAALESNSVEEFADYGGSALVATVGGGVFGGLTAYSLPGHTCFVAGTLVKTQNGDLPIESIKAGDMVWAWDEVTGDIALKEVVETYTNATSELIHVYVNGEEIVTTPTHPFYSPVKGWTDAAKLRAGDILVLVNGEYVVVERVQHELLESPIAVYNFQVEEYHTYYVAGSGVLVHNSCNHNNEWNKERTRYWKETASNAVEGQNYGAYTATPENIARMKRGVAPIGWDGYSVQLHHWSGIANDFYNYSPVSWTLHQLIHWG